MSNKRILLGLAAVFAMSCTSPQKTTTQSTERAPQASNGPDEESIKFENTYQAVMTMSGSTDEDRANEVRNYLRRQMQYFYLAQNLVMEFDKKLDRLHAKKMKNPNADLSKDLEDFEKDRVSLHIAWEFKERNLHDVERMYQRVLKDANNPSAPYQSACSLALEKIEGFMADLWNKDQWAAISTVEELEDLNEAFKAQNPNGRTANFEKYLNVSQKERKAAFFSSMRKFKRNRDTYVDKKFSQIWEKYKASRMEDHMDSTKDRKPQSDTLYPDAGGNGNITGNRFGAGVWAITLDDGPSPKYTPGMLEAISGADMRATFFWLSQNIQAYPSMPTKAHDAGFKRASHSFSHANLPTLGDNGLRHEIDEAAQVFTDVIGERPTFFRCPYGACGGNGSRIRQRIANLKMMHVFWNVDSLDWQDKNPSSIFERVRKQMEVNGHGIVLFHDIHPQSVEAVKLLVAYMKQRNLRAYTMDEIYKLETGNEYYSP